MKKRTRVIIRIIGVACLITAMICAIKGSQDGIFNGLDFAVIFFGIGGLYLTFGSEKSLESWRLKNVFDDLDDPEDLDDLDDLDDPEDLEEI